MRPPASSPDPCRDTCGVPAPGSAHGANPSEEGTLVAEFRGGALWDLAGVWFGFFVKWLRFLCEHEAIYKTFWVSSSVS